MKKIAIIGKGHAGSTIPLIREFVLKGFVVDYYILSLGSVHDIEAADISFSTKKKGIVRVPSDNWGALYNYFGGNDSVNIFTINTPRPFEKMFLLKHVISLYRSLLIRSICKNIDKKHYQFVNIVGRYDVYDIIKYCSYLKSKTIVSLHEVCNHSAPDFTHPNKVLKCLFKINIPIVVFSKKSFDDILRYNLANPKNIYQINFGLFSSYAIFRGRYDMLLPERYLLFIGRITPYKGLPSLYEAYNLLSSSTKEKVKIVIAGSGHDEYVEKMKRCDSFVVINRFLKNEEIVELIERAEAVVCPYTSASQSGIPQTVFVFGKPIIATNILGLNDVIKNEYNGLLIDTHNPTKLADKIENIWNDSRILKGLSHDMKEFEDMFPYYSWKFIADCYLKNFVL